LDLRKIFQFFSSNLLIQVLNLVFSVLVIKLLSLPDIGKYNLAKGLSNGFQYASLSFRQAMDRRLPRSSEKVGASQLAVVILINTVISVLFLIAILVYYRFDLVFAIYCSGGLLFSVFSLYKIFYRGTGQLATFIQANIVVGVLSVVLPLTGVLLYGLTGLAIGYFLSCAAAVMYGRKYFGEFKKIVFHKPYIRKLFLAGLPLYLSSLFVFFGDYLDRFLIDSYINRSTVGEFSIVMLLYSVMILIPSSILEMTYPEYIRNKQYSKRLKQIIGRHLKINVISVGVAVGGVLAALPYVFRFFFPSYLYLLPYCYIICAAVVPYTIIPVLWSLLFSFDKGYSILRSSGFALFVYLLILGVMLENGTSFRTIIWLKVMFPYIYLCGLLYYVIRFKLHKILIGER
jgi:O-antigen/teichoic acid export membrane protein